ncbi:hypothetical protein [Nocardiopsis listeri]|uniref:hypothetical protein n=1 Tax=Nocardiopsis listeri TaxID=53440 RepID=UPI0012EED85A|nr:hypothetical protein [Nocardiopsis listeri]
MTESTAKQHVRACQLVLESLRKDPSRINVLELDIEHAVHLFRTTNPQLKESTLDTYEYVFRRAVLSYGDYLRDPAAWEAPTKRKSGDKGTRKLQTTPRPKKEKVELKLPLREGKHALLILPENLTEADRRLLERIIPVYLEDYAEES